MKQFFENPIFLGAIGVMLSGSVMYLFRNIPLRLITILWNRLVAEISISDDNAAYHWLEEWLIAQPFVKRSKRLMVSQSADDGRKLTLVPGYGFHLFFAGWRPVWMNRENLLKDHGKASGPSKMITIKTLDLGRSSVEKIYEQIRDAAESRQRLRVFTCSPWGYWTLLLKREHRPLSTVFVNPAVKKKILDHIAWYLENKKWYTDHGIPYRTGLLLFGPPGTGKTSLVHALAGAFDLSIHMLNPSDLDSENALRTAMANVGQRSILLIEDADASIAPRPKAEETKPATGALDLLHTTPIERKGPSLSAVLNALDGITAAEGRILILTSNYPERLDSALIRDGRVDMRVEIGKLDRGEALAMAESFFPGCNGLTEIIDKEEPKTGAEWQTFFAEMTKPHF